MSTPPRDANMSTPPRDANMSTPPRDANMSTHARGGMMDLSAGFAEPVAGAQECFRAVLDAMSRPGRIRRIGGVTPPAPLGVAAAAVLLTLADHETPLWLDPAAEAAWPWIGFHSGAPRCEPGAAAFGLALSLPDLGPFPAGSHESPEGAATLIVQVAALGRGRVWRLAGPGLRTPAPLAVDGLPEDFATRWATNRGQFPRGIDLVLCAGAQVTALPRSVTVEES